MTTGERVYSEAELPGRLTELKGWYASDGTLRRDYETDGWPTTLMLANAIGFLAQAADHHPELQLSWGKLTVRLSTHSASGVTDKDISLARQIEQIALWRPSPGGPLAGTKSPFVQGGQTP